MSLFVTRLKSPVHKEEVIHYRDESFYIDISNPTWQQVVDAVNRLDNTDFNEEVRLYLMYSNYRFISVVGGVSASFLLYICGSNTGNVFLEDTSRVDTEKFVYLGEYPGVPERFTFDSKSVLRVLKHFYDFGEAQRGLSWVRWAEIETNPEEEFW